MLNFVIKFLVIKLEIMLDQLYVQPEQYPICDILAWKITHSEVHLFIYINLESCYTLSYLYKQRTWE